MSINTPALAHETTTTTGTGSYTLLGAASALVRTFASAIAEGADAYVPYVCRSRTSADFEIGIGELSASTTLERTSIVESSNGNAAVNWAAGTKDIYVGNGATAPHGKHFLQANPTTPVYDEYPGATGFDSEITAGFGLGSLFQYFDGAAGDGGLHAAGLWLCAGPTGSAANLDWVYLSRHITPVYRTDATGTVRGGICLGGVAYAEGANSATAGGAVAIGDSAHVENHTSFYEGGPWDEGATPGESQTGSRTHGVRTTDDTPAECGAVAPLPT